MHEISIAESVLDGVRRELLRYPGARPTRVGLKVGELAGVDVDSLSFCFDSVLRGTSWEGLQLVMRVCAPVRRCLACEKEFAVVDYQSACPDCGSDRTLAMSGDELDFEFLEVETDGDANGSTVRNGNAEAEGVE